MLTQVKRWSSMQTSVTLTVWRWTGWHATCTGPTRAQTASRWHASMAHLARSSSQRTSTSRGRSLSTPSQGESPRLPQMQVLCILNIEVQIWFYYPMDCGDIEFSSNTSYFQMSYILSIKNILNLKLNYIYIYM